MKRIFWFGLLLFLLLPAACVKAPPEKPQVVAPAAVAVDWSAVEGWQWEDPRPALEVFRSGCGALRWRQGWQRACQQLAALEHPSEVDARRYFEQNFRPWQLQQEDGSTEGLLTGYYVPDLKGSRVADETYRYPIYGVPDDLLVIDLSDLYPELGKYRLRGRLDGRTVVPYWDRAAIDANPAHFAGKELFWVDDPVELFFLQIQGSGRILLPDGERVMVNYADQNGHPYRSIGKLLLERGAMTREQMSMQNIRAWAKQNPDQVGSLLEENPSYVFFRELGAEFRSPPGAMGLPLSPRRSLAVDPHYVPLGAPVFIKSSWPVDQAPLQRLMVAQDTGGAIKGRVRADFFWGMGDEAGFFAGRTKQPLRLWMLLPAGVTPLSVKGEK